jgi:hypothetical protein
MEHVSKILPRNVKAPADKLNSSQDERANRTGIYNTYLSGIETQASNLTTTVVAKVVMAPETTTA